MTFLLAICVAIWLLVSIVETTDRGLEDDGSPMAGCGWVLLGIAIVVAIWLKGQ